MGDVEAGSMKTLLEILKRSEHTNAKIQALELLLGFTGSNDGLETVYKNAVVIFNTLIDLTFGTDSNIAEKAFAILINISAEEHGSQLLISTKLSEPRMHVQNDICKNEDPGPVISILLEHSLSYNSFVTGQACMILANITRAEVTARKIFNCLENPFEILNKIVIRLLEKNVNVDYLACFLSNLSQLPEVRKILLDSQDILEKLLTLVNFKNLVFRRKWAIGVIRNLCFSIDNHETLLNPKIDLLSSLLLPLAGSEEFDEEDNEKLPLELQYLPHDKTREPDQEIRKMLLEILTQLCTTRFGREIMRQSNVYVILREYHKWEENLQCIDTVENLVNFLIRTEEEIGIDNLQNIDIPSDLIEKFN